ncbi:Dapk1 [Symbiodinium natans]|uniref:Dapk1 protein n=1 Tax=Symbiodinium natans TaxID=878477 RepID=A0A812T7H9_9DINO|nr:Dapk1 [Symbiodinium natans]
MAAEPVLSVCSMVSGAVVAELDDAAFKALCARPGGGLRCLAGHLHAATGCPRFRQRLFAEGTLITDESDLSLPCSLQLVLLPLCTATSKQREEVGKAILLQKADLVEDLLWQCHDPNMVVPHGRSALHALTVAALSGSRGCLSLLLEA